MATVSGHVKLRKRKRGDQWYMKYRTPTGHQVEEKIGPAWKKRSKPPKGSGYFTKATANDKLQEVLGELRRGEIPDPGQRSGKTFADAMAEYLRFIEVDEGRRESTVKGYKSTAAVLLKEFGPDVYLEAIDSDRINAYRSKALEETKLSRRSVQKHIVQLRGVFKRAKRLGWISSNPMDDVDPVKLTPETEFNVLTVQQVELVAGAADPMFGAAIIVAAFTGLRTGEIRALRWRDIDFTGAMIQVRRNIPSNASEGTTKSAKPRSTPLMDDAASALDAVSKRGYATGPDDYVFCDELGQQLNQDALRDTLYAALEEVGIDRKAFPARGGFTFHDLRHTFGTIAVRVWPLSDVQAYMGHADIQTTMKYVHHVPKTTAAAEMTAAIRKAKSDGVAVAGGSPKTSPKTSPEHAPTQTN